MKKSDIKSWCLGVHALGAITLFIGPLIIYFVHKEKEIQKHTRKVLNWQFSLIIYLIIASLVPVASTVLIVINILFSIIGFVKAENNEYWNYPLSIPFFKN